MAEAGVGVKAGQEVRLVNIPVQVFGEVEEKGNVHGVFHDIYGYDKGSLLADHIKMQAGKYYGTAFPAYIERLTKDLERDRFADWVAEKRISFVNHHVPSEVGGQIGRVAKKFALVGIAGELATEWGITGWPKGEAMRAADNAFRRWLYNRGGNGNLEEKQILQQVRLFFEREGEAGFTRWCSEDAKVDEHAPRSMKRYGFRKTDSDRDPLEGESTENHYYIFSESFRAEVCKGYDPVRVARLLRDRGALMCDEEKAGSRLQRSVRLPGMGKSPTKCYVIKHSALYGELGG
jgi:uncharacterized protein (DUF927 family)